MNIDEYQGKLRQSFFYQENGRYEEAISLYSDIIQAYPYVANAIFNRGVLFHNLGKRVEAKRDFVLASRMDDRIFTMIRNKGLGEYLHEISGQVVEVGENDNQIENDYSNNIRKTKFWPDAMNILSIDHLQAQIKSELDFLYPNTTPFLSPSSPVVTLGSCFAINLGRVLKSKGFNVTNALVPEDVNSTYANKYLFDWLVNGNKNKFTAYFAALYGEERRENLRKVLEDAKLLIITVGVAPCLFHSQCNEFAFTSPKNDKAGFEFLEGTYKLRTTTVKENVDNLKFIVELLYKINSDLKIVISVSPVPLSGTNEMDSILIADCISKSTIRLAVHELLTILPQIIYWPSFEIVRWLGGHSEFRMYGKDDNHSRHVNNQIVDLIIGLFLEKFSQPQ